MTLRFILQGAPANRVAQHRVIYYTKQTAEHTAIDDTHTTKSTNWNDTHKLQNTICMQLIHHIQLYVYTFTFKWTPNTFLRRWAYQVLFHN